MSSIAPDVLLGESGAALATAETLLAQARGNLGIRVGRDGAVDAARLDQEQLAAHGLAWMATYVAALRQLRGWASRLDGAGEFAEPQRLILAVGFGEYLAQLAGGIAMGQGEIARPQDLGLDDAAVAPLRQSALVVGLGEARAALGAILAEGMISGGDSLGDETLELIRDQVRRFAERAVAPYAHDWHRADKFIPIEVIEELSGIGVFGVTLPEEYGGLGLGKLAMCVVSEELSRAYIGVGSLGTRSEIAGELIRVSGTAAQKARWLPDIASGAVLPTAVFTEPNAGSDLASLQTRAVKDGDVYRIYGAKTWITHAARSDVMTLLARTGSPDSGYRGLSMFLAPKPRGDDANPFPAEGMSGTEIPVLGYRGMKEYEIGFDGFAVPADQLLGGVEGEGFKQLMATFESARVQTAARAVGVAQNAFELAMAYAQERRQFGRNIVAFPRVQLKLTMMAVETMMARQLAYFAAREKDSGRRCDIEAGMAKLLAARVAWGNADNAVQIHGGNGYAIEYPISRVLCDARILNIFEGAAEIQAQIIARGLLAGRN
ncbi:MAG TPA: acyl-CoA dehydrogenase family protein [Stellaceae bacterium]|jgi:(2S)-methylsuccinyl-CoA dehydrogenase|nr:acyl-CoA dehydrogenase family protein [Stellaceae bacterium]